MANVRVLFLVAACSSVAACAHKPSELAAPPVAAATATRVATDGTYRGTSTRFQADRRDCPHPGLVTLFVQDHQFEYRWTPELYIDAVIDPDDRVHGLGPDVTLNGRRDGATIDGDVTNGACGLHFTARKSS